MAGRMIATRSTGGAGVFRKKSPTEVIGEELQEGFAHLGAAVSEARKATAEQLRPQVEAATKAAQAAYAADLAPRVEAAVAALTPRGEAAAAAPAPPPPPPQEGYG